MNGKPQTAEVLCQPYNTICGAQILPAYVQPSGLLELGVFTSSSQFVTGSDLVRSRGRVSMPGKPAKEVGYIDQKVVYAGPLLNHYGHFILESLGRLSVAKQYPDLSIAWSCRVPLHLNKKQLNARARLFPFQKSILKRLGISNNNIFVTEPTEFAEVVVPETGYRISDHFSLTHQKFLGIERYKPQKGKKIWLSRSRLKCIFDIGEINSSVIEERLRSRGWIIFHSQEHCFDSQIKELATAERVAGFEGSALHNLIFVKNCNELKVDIVKRRHKLNPNYINIANAKEFSQSVHTMIDRDMIKTKGAHSLSCSPKPDALISDIENDIYENDILSIRITDQLVKLVSQIIELKTVASLLTLGISNVSEWDQLNVKEVTYVNNSFHHDYAGRESELIHFFEIPPEFYLKNYCDGSKKIDLIIINGNSTVELFLRFQIAFKKYSSNFLWVLNLNTLEAKKTFDKKEFVLEREVSNLAVMLANFPVNIDFRMYSSKNDYSFIVKTGIAGSFLSHTNSDYPDFYLNYFDGITSDIMKSEVAPAEILQWIGRSSTSSMT